MSNVAIKGGATGTATYTLEAPTGNTDRTLVLPDEAGTVLTSASVLESLSIQGTLSDDTQTTPETLLTIGASYNSIGANGGAGAGARIEIQVPDDETNPTTGAAIGSIKTSADDSDSSSGLAFYTSNNDTTLDEAARIDSSGNLLVGGTTYNNDVQSLSVGMCSIGADGVLLCHASVQPLELARTSGDNDERAHVQFWREGSLAGQIRCTNTSTAYNTSSDYRLKENVVDMTGAITRVKALAPKRFNFIANENDTTVDGFLAHEAQTVVPESVSGTHNEVDDEGNPVYQGIDQAKLVPLLTGALQEAIAKIETLETTVADLQTRVTALEATP